jgi:hypothetical protein
MVYRVFLGTVSWTPAFAGALTAALATLVDERV